MSSRRAFKGDSVAIEIGDSHPKDHLAQRRLIRRAFHEGLIQPGTENQQDDRNATAQNPKTPMRNATHHSCHPETTENHANGGTTTRKMMASIMAATTRIQNPP